MPVNIEIKGNLAKLLATENLIIEHKAVDTASFDIERRVLTLPQWEIDSNYVYDMLVAHEVGHALFTPFRDWRKEEKYKDVPKDYINVVEDARIEKLMKQKYAGLNRDFCKGYEELHAQNFFDIEDEDVNDLKLIDRINLYFKIGAYLCIDFNDEENQIITEITQAETFEQVLDISKKLHLLGQKQKEEVEALELQQLAQLALETGMQSEDGTPATPVTLEPSDESDDNAPETEGKGNTPDKQVEDDDLEDEKPEVEASNKAGNHADIDVASTQRSFDRNAETLNSTEDVHDTQYINIPEIDIDSVQIKFNVLRDSLKKTFSYKTADTDPATHPYELSQFNSHLDLVFEEFNKFKNSARKDVNNLVKEFEMKKSADAYSRSATSRTGMLDMNKLHTYKYNEDIFKKVTTIPEGKNHGLVFLLDWSGSMHYQLEDTLKQLFKLVWFCRKVQIPFEVYAFTNDSYLLDDRLDPTLMGRYSYDAPLPEHVKSKVLGEMVIPNEFRMVNILSSQERGRDLDEMMKLIFTQCFAMCKHFMEYNRKFQLSGTPLNEAIIAVGQITKHIIKTTGIQKCHVVVLTDGDGFHSDVWRESTNPHYDKRPYKACIYTGRSVIRQGHKTFSGGNSQTDFTLGLVRAVKSELPNCSFLGIRLLERDYRHFYMGYARNSYMDFEEMKAQNKREGMIHFKTDSFDEWYGISCTKLRVDDELTVDQGADKRSITTAFKKMNRGKKTNRVMVRQFIDQIA